MLHEQVQSEMINLTPAAAEAVRGLLVKRNLEAQEYALRVFIAGGGCSGYQYGMALEANIRPEDLVAEFDGVRVVVDEVSINYLHGASVDYVESVMGSGFKIENPNAISSCGCGSSFRTKDSEASGGGCSSCG
ncbi:MAG: heme biosynthesis protein HemY [Chloroflexi bacterium RBG_16_57_11]|nr:MAG: heme biosynthesis protein HemY [Chloroflexi bacterium RBG_16_57_11]